MDSYTNVFLNNSLNFFGSKQAVSNLCAPCTVPLYLPQQFDNAEMFRSQNDMDGFLHAVCFKIKLLHFQQQTGLYPPALLYIGHSNLTMQKCLVVRYKYFGMSFSAGSLGVVIEGAG